MSVDPVQTIHDTYVSRYKRGAQSRPNGDFHRIGRISLASGGGADPMFNFGFVFEPPSSNELEQAVKWMRDQEVPFWLNVADDALSTIEDFADDDGLSPIDMVLSGMLRPTLNELPKVDTVAEISEVSTPDDEEAYYSVFDDVFDIQREHEPREGSEDSGTDDRSSLYIGRVDGRSVACGGMIRIDEVANVVGMAVLEEFRGRGIGTAICSESLRAAREAGCEIATLESTPMAVSLYESLGFETHVDYHLFELAD